MTLERFTFIAMSITLTNLIIFLNLTNFDYFYITAVLINNFMNMAKRTIVTLPGDGIGAVVLPEAFRVLDAAGFEAELYSW